MWARGAALLWAGLLCAAPSGAWGAENNNITIKYWDGDNDNPCEGTPDRVESFVRGGCYPRATHRGNQSGCPTEGSTDVIEYFRLDCAGFLTLEVVESVYTDPDCRGDELQQALSPGACLEEICADDNPIIVAYLEVECGSHSVGIPTGLMLVAFALLGVCACGHFHARRTGRSFLHHHRRTTRSASGESIYDPSTAALAYQRRSDGPRRDAQPNSSAADADGFAQEELPPACLAIVEAAGDTRLTMQQITQAVLSSGKIAPADKRHCMMLLFRHYGFAGDEQKSPAGSPRPPPPPGAAPPNVDEELGNTEGGRAGRIGGSE